MDTNIFVEISGYITAAVQSKVQSAIELSPFVLGALAVFLFGWILAELVSRFIISASEKLRLEVISDKLGLTHMLQRAGAKKSSSHVIAKGVKAYLIFVFFIEATKVAQLTKVAEFLSAVIGYIPDLMIALFIILIGIRFGNTFEKIISGSLNFTKSTTANILGVAVKWITITFAILAALSELQIAEILVQTLFIGFVAMLTLAGGLAFGLGGKDVVKELLEAIKRVEIKEHKKK